mgnify:CR=1 FL=1
MLRNKFSHFMFVLFCVCFLVACNFVRGETHEQIVYSLDWTLWVMNPDGSNQRQLLKPGMIGVDPQWSPDGKRILFSSNDSNGKWSVWIADANGQNPQAISPAFNSVHAIWLNPNILLTRVITDTGQTWNNPMSQFVLNLETREMNSYLNGVETMQPLPDGNQWASWNSASGMTIFSLSSEPKTLFRDYIISGPWCFDVSPFGDEVVFYGAQKPKQGFRLLHAIYRAKIDFLDEVVPTKIIESERPAIVRWSPDGKWIAVLDNYSKLQIIATENNTVKNIYQIEFPPPGQDLQWSPDSVWLMFSSSDYDASKDNRLYTITKFNRVTGESVQIMSKNAVHWGGADWSIVEK